MTSNEQRKEPSNTLKGNSVGTNDWNRKFGLLECDDLTFSSISSNSMATTMTNSNSSITLQPIDRPELSNSSSSSSCVNNSFYRPEHSHSKVPSPKIPIQFQLSAAKINYLESQKSVAFDKKRIDSSPTVVTSGTNSKTVNLTNRSLVYSESVSTKSTAPTKNIIGINTSGFATNPAISPKYSIHSPGIGNASNSSAVTSKFGILSTHSLVLPAARLDSNESESGTSVNLSYTNRTILQQSFNDSISNLENNIRQNHQNKHSEQTVNDKMNEIILKNSIHKRNRAKSTLFGDLQIIDSEIPEKISRTKSNESTTEILNLDCLPEKADKPCTKMFKTSNQQDYLFKALKEDGTKCSNGKYELKKEQKSIPIASSSNNIRISNGQLSHINGPIRLLDQPTKHISTPSVFLQNDAIASLPAKDKARKLKESIETSETVLSMLENGDEKQIKRTYSRSKSFSVKPSIQFKIDRPKSKSKLKIQSQKSDKPSIEQDKYWQAHTNALQLSMKPVESSGAAEKIIYENDSRSQSPSEIEHILSWNTSKTLGQLPSSQLIFQRNEFGMTEMDMLAMTKLKAMKLHKNDYKNFPHLEPSMACGHSDSAACFDAIIQRLNSINSNTNCKVNEKKPHQYYSTEFKQIIGALVQNKNNNCQAITTEDVKDALRETNMYDRTKNSSHFSWSRFIDYYNKKYSSEKSIKLASPELFANTIPRTPNTFEIGQKLEAIDPQNSDLFCVCTIVDKCGYRIKLRFDGSPSTYDFWVNADSKYIFPAGWCTKTGRELEVNRRLINNRTMTFEWKEYLRQTNTQAAHRACFPNVNTARTQMNPFKIGMKLEADDVKNTGRICVATIGDVIDSQILVRFDELDSSYNYWTDIRSPSIHPINFHQDGSYSITSPPSWKSVPFSWEAYLRMNRAEPVPQDAFHMREPKAFSNGMALEVVDKKNPTLIRPAIITMVQEYQIKVLFIGWAEKYSYWVDDDSSDIFPPGYCKRTGHPIECPLDFIYEPPKNSCGILGCRGIGNAKHPEVSTHTTLEECPYEWNNWSTIDSDVRPNRIDRKHKTVNSAFNIGAGPSRKISVNPAFEKVQVSLQPTLNPAELAAMSKSDVEIFRRLQVSANFLLENRKVLSELRDQWLDRIKPLRTVQIIAAAKNPLNWTKEEVAKFVSQLPNCSTLGSIFIENDIDGFAFLALRKSDMIDVMGLSTGAAIKVFNRIMLLREECNTHYIRYE